MTWTTFASDGYAIGNMNFLNNYRLPKSDLLFKKENATIAEFTADPDNHNWDIYQIRSDLGYCNIHLRQTLRSTVCASLGIENIETLVGKPISAYYQDRTIQGITPLTSK